MTRRAGLLALVALLAAGCGYSLRGNLPPHLRTVAVPVFANRTLEPAVDSIMTGAVTEAFVTDGRLKVVRVEDADAILEGEVVAYQVQSIAFDPDANVRQYRVLITVNVRFRDVRHNTVLFEQQGFQERSDFTVVGSVADTIAREEAALRPAAVAIARVIVARAVERF